MQSSKTKLEPEQETHEFSRRFHSKSITNSFVSRNISSNSKCRARKRSSINKMLVFKRDLNKSSRHSSSWKDKSVLSKLAKVDFKPEYSVGGGVFEELISYWEKIRRLSPCNQSENVEPFHLCFYN